MVPIARLELTSCPLGCPAGDEIDISGSDLLHGLPGRFTVLRCKTCGLRRTSPRPTPQDISIYYPDDYGPYKSTRVVTARTDNALNLWLAKILKHIFDTKSQILPRISPGRLLEIGCASGSYLHRMARVGWQVEGIEFSLKAAEAARALGYKVDTAALEGIEKPANSYDLIVGWMVLEHLHEPIECLRKLASWAKPNASLVISVPNIGSAEARVFGSYWYALQLPTHLYHYDTATIVKVMEDGGWVVTRIHHHRVLTNLIVSMGYWLRSRGCSSIAHALIELPVKYSRAVSVLLFPLAFILAYVGQTGRMTVWAKRAC
jgi:2-polyprenyl-3-methyl-5-hydroxy-6-metoxy-1,4-benzoquinol methylase